MGSERENIQEADLSRAWAESRLPADLRLVDGRRIQIIYRGIWSNSNGPDFKDALISIDGRLERGAVEIHLTASDWYRHGHDTDQAYEAVTLHVVHLNDRTDGVRTANGRQLPTLELGEMVQLGSTGVGSREAKIIASLGGRTCLPTLGTRAPERVRSVLRERGWSRLAEKQLRFAQELQVLIAPEVFYLGILDSLGYSANREPMRQVGQRLPLQLLERFARSAGTLAPLAGLLGASGFLPLSPSIQEAIGYSESVASLEHEWKQICEAYQIEAIRDSAWTLNRVRPTNHPAVRLASFAALIAAGHHDSLFERFMLLPLDGGATWDRWLSSVKPAIGASRRRQIIVNIFAPFLAAYAEVTRDDDLAERVAEDWERLPGAVSDRITRTARQQILGTARFPVRLALEEQGLHDIHRNGCSELRCFECPIARLAVEHERWEGTAID